MTNRASHSPTSKTSHKTIFFPLLGDRSGLMTKTHLVPIIVTIAAGVALATAWGGGFDFISIYRPESLNRAIQVCWILGGYMTFLVNYFVYRLCDYDKSWRVMLGVFVIMAILMLFPLAPLAGFYNGLVFPGGPEAATPMWRIFGAFFGPGLGEELIKALPVFALVIVGARYTQPFAKRVGVFEPLDGILIGVASASAFALMETMLGYIWQQINQETVPWIVEACKAAGLRPGQYTPDCVAAGITAGSNWGNVGVGGIMSTLYRGLPNIAGHIAYSGVFGYFIGLAALRKSFAPVIVLVGWITAATLHGCFDAAWFSTSSIGYFGAVVTSTLVAVLSYAFLGSAILKGQRISPTRPRTPIIDPPLPPRPPLDPGPRPEKPGERVDVGVFPQPVMLKIRDTEYSLTDGFEIKPRMLGTKGAGRPLPLARVQAVSGGFLQLVSLDSEIWKVRQGGKRAEVANGQRLSLMPGTTIDFGGVEAIVRPGRVSA
jgi:RsiW-degrading membrane proteinase PrsW (M82 family)